ncbi:DUF3613 domain-containing protein [Solimonas flava]|uniref:DUF3613 domain-containing protein n=1 Tax=Solimonas flava TaxID=415849 RepID=UPI0003F800F0|nr:DUF3613 domain-containing protein [Solimonas flava]
MKKKLAWIGAALTCAMSAAFAQDAVPAPDDTAAAPAAAQPVAEAAPLPQIGGDTRSWLAMQKDAAAQTPDLRPVPGEIAEQVYQRYVNSFKHPIPEEFKRDSFVESGGGGGS